MTETQRRDVWFTSGTDRCHAWLYLPVGATAAAAAADAEAVDAVDLGQTPVIVMAHGLGGIKALRLDVFAQKFRAAGYACLVFDYRHFGQSEGEPRELLSIRRQREDWRAAVAYARRLSRHRSARIVVWGTSFAGGHAIATAAHDPEIEAVIAQCPFTSGLASTRQIGLGNAVGLTAAGIADVAASLFGRGPVRVPVAANPGERALMSARDVKTGIRGLLDASGIAEADYPDQVPARIALQIPFSHPGRQLRKLKAPALLCICDNDTVAPAKASHRYAVRAGSHVTARSYSAGHFDIYLDGFVDQLIDDQLEFLHAAAPLEPAARLVP